MLDYVNWSKHTEDYVIVCELITTTHKAMLEYVNSPQKHSKLRSSM